jgi:hypothetical protein
MIEIDQKELQETLQRDRDFQETVENLHSDDLLLQTSALKVLAIDPLGDQRILPYLEALLTDTTPCLVAIPYMFGEIRWLAARALAKERAVLGIEEKVYLHNVVKPLNTQTLADLGKEAHIQGYGGIDGILEMFAELSR